MSALVAAFLPYMTILLPGLALFAAALLLVPPALAWLRIPLYVAIFVLLRDAMTPAGLWRIDSALRLEFHPDPLVLAGLGLTSLLLVVALYAFDGANRRHLVFWRTDRAFGLGIGLVAGIAVAAPFMAVTGNGFAKFAVPAEFLLGLAVLALLGNLLEEVLFRGYVQNALAERMPALRAAAMSGVLFAACHGYLAITVTDAGWPILVFTLAEGLVCALVALRYGIFAATLCHGTAIFLMAGAMA
jgi:membrane protease YdiL (CAAX protease family)